MEKWIPVKCFENQDVYIIGGGPSLQDFDWNLLHGKNTIGCNTAFTLGPSVCKICFFSDLAWFDTFKDELKEYARTNWVITHNTQINEAPDWLKILPRYKQGALHTDGLGYGGSSGDSAINLALLLGAKRVFLLGIDCSCQKISKPNWHDRVIEPLHLEVYQKFIQGFSQVASELPLVFPGREVIHLTENSALSVFPRQSLYSHFSHDTQYSTI